MDMRKAVQNNVKFLFINCEMFMGNNFSTQRTHVHRNKQKNIYHMFSLHHLQNTESYIKFIKHTHNSYGFSNDSKVYS
jgi:hypothetical protein